MPWETITATVLILVGLLQYYFAALSAKSNKERQSDPDLPAPPKPGFLSSPLGGVLIGTVFVATGLYSFLT